MLGYSGSGAWCGHKDARECWGTVVVGHGVVIMMLGYSGSGAWCGHKDAGVCCGILGYSGRVLSYGVAGQVTEYLVVGWLVGC